MKKGTTDWAKKYLEKKTQCPEDFGVLRDDRVITFV